MNGLVNHTKLSFSQIFPQNKITDRQFPSDRIWCFSLIGSWIVCWFWRGKFRRLDFFRVAFKPANFEFCTMDLFIIVCVLAFRDIKSKFVFIKSFIIARFLIFWRIVFIVIFLLESFNIFFSLWGAVDLALYQKINLWFFLFFFRLQPSFSFFF